MVSTGENGGHRHAPNRALAACILTELCDILLVTRKGGRKAKILLTLATGAAIDACRADRAGLGESREMAGPLMAIATGGRLGQGHLPELVRRLARDAPGNAGGYLPTRCGTARSPSRNAGAILRDLKDYAGHGDPRTTRRYDHSRDSLDRNAACSVATCLS